MIIFFLMIFAGGLGAAADPHYISIDCGGDAHGGKHWLGEGSSTISTVKGDLITARISRSRFSYSLQLSPGQKFLRLHFHPSSYNGFESSNDFFTVEAGDLPLLANFSASITARALAVDVVVKQFCVTVEENETLNLVFSPEWGNSYAFINEIEIISLPSTTPYCDGRVCPNPIIHVDNSTALERVHYQHVKWGPVSSGDDIASMFGMWSKQPSVGEGVKIGTNKTWRVSVDAGFKYLVRLHLCEAGLHMDFVLLINGRVALTSADMLHQRRGNTNLLWYNNYMAMVDTGDISVTLHSRHEFLDRHGPLEGFEVFKTSSHQSASCLIQAEDSPSRTLLHSLLYNIYGNARSWSYTIIVHICCIVFIVYLELKMSQYEFTKEDNKPSSRAKQLSHRFSLAGILGICEYGGVGKGFVDYGREIVGIKPLEIDSNQRENKFQTVIEQQETILVDKLARKSNDFFPQSWKQRHQICIGVSRALEHLHTSPMIIHHDLKPANILLDDKFVAKLSDFGVAKFGSFSESQRQDSTKLILRFGYTVPGIITTSVLTKQNDINSFGALVLKVLRGRAAREPQSEEDKCSLTTLAERTKVEDVDYDKSQQENMNLIVPNEKIDFDNHVSGISLSDVWFHSIRSRDFHLRAERLKTIYKSLYCRKSSVELGLQQQMPQWQVPPVQGEGGFGSVYKRFMNSESDQGFREWQVKPGVLMDSSTGSQKCQMPPGFRFQPTDVELLSNYLQKKLAYTRLEIDLYNYDPWDLPKRSFFGEKEWFFFSTWDRKRAWGATSRHQKVTGMHNPVMPRGKTKRAMMHEYMLGAARDMAFLHAVEKPVIYRDFKASIILLDELYKAKLSAHATLCFKKLNPLKEWQVELGVLMDSSTGSQQWQMPPEIQLHPTDEDYVHFIGFFNYEQRDLPKWSFFGEQRWFFFSPWDRKRTQGATSGHQKATGMHNPVMPKGITEWAMMLESMLEDDTNCPHRQYNDWLKHKTDVEYPPSTLPLQKLTFKSHWS
ncbi:receptor-like protein kinase FERONIA [Salvia divinorum]|uniref:Receptor-like protein kinase FERONIA n=1 Tax=Salvia divinorum TaxID=28513 RepID=A0ABD1IKC1_SALDI